MSADSAFVQLLQCYRRRGIKHLSSARSPVKDAEVEPEPEASDHAVVGFPHGEVVDVVPGEFLSRHIRVVPIVPV